MMQIEIAPVIQIAIIASLTFIVGWLAASGRYRLREKHVRADATKRQRAVIGGQVSEKLAPYFPDFPYRPSEARFIGAPVDFVIFDGMDEKTIRKVVFVEVKTGQSRLSKVERQVKEALEQGRVEWLTYRSP